MTPGSIRSHTSERFPLLSEGVSPHRQRQADRSAAISPVADLPKHYSTVKFTSPLLLTPKHSPGLLLFLSKPRTKERSKEVLPPAESPQWPETKRLIWTRKQPEEDRPLLIVNFEGVIGQWLRPGFGEPYELYVRSGWEAGLRALAGVFELALVTSLERAKRSKLLALLASKGVPFDAVYKKRKCDGTSFVLDYGQIIAHFGFTGNEKAVLVLASVGLEQEELTNREGLSLIREESVSRSRRYLCNCSPGDRRNASVPVCFLVPNPAAQAGLHCARFDFIARTVLDWMRTRNFARKSACDFPSLFPTALLGVKKLEIPSDLLFAYRDTLQTCSSVASGGGRSARFLVLTGAGKTAGTMTAGDKGNKASPRRLCTRSHFLQNCQPSTQTIETEERK